jgi:hypothetical protein
LASFAGGIAIYYAARSNLGAGVVGGGALLLLGQLAWS